MKTLLKFILFWWTILFVGIFVMSVDSLTPDLLFIGTLFCVIFIYMSNLFLSEKNISDFTGWTFLSKHLKEFQQMKHFQLNENIDSKLIATLDFEDFDALIRNASIVKEWVRDMSNNNIEIKISQNDIVMNSKNPNWIYVFDEDRIEIWKLSSIANIIEL